MKPHIITEEDFENFAGRTLWASDGSKTLISEVTAAQSCFKVFHTGPGKAMSGEGENRVFKRLDLAIQYYNDLRVL